MLLPLVVFVIGISALCLILHASRRANFDRNYAKGELTASTYATRMSAQINYGAEATGTLKQLIVVGNGTLSDENFDRAAKNLINEMFLSLQIAPGGVVSRAYPAGSASPSARSAAEFSLSARRAKDESLVIIDGPFVREDGKTAISVRNPVYVTDGAGNETFWGYTIAEMPVPEIFRNSTDPLAKYGYNYNLTKSDESGDDPVSVCNSGAEMTNPVSYSFDLGRCVWTLSVEPIVGWHHGSKSLAICLCGAALVILITALAQFIVFFSQSRKKYKDMAVIDQLTGVLNRVGFSEEFQKYTTTHSGESCVCALVDVDDFKLVNDLHGHNAGDAALKSLARTLTRTLPESSITARSGGDEFMFVLKNTTAKEAASLIESLVVAPHAFTYRGTEHSFRISIGYAECPADARDESELLRKADVALYKAKIRGKHNCFAYTHDLKTEHRSKLGFALSDVSENLPGAFLIYKADPDDDAILYANNEMVRLAVCDGVDDFMKFSKRKFGNLISPDERDAVVSSIWEQINSRVNGSNDYVKFNLVAKNGELKPVLDHGRIVNTEYFGRVFYVLIIDSALLATHYADDVVAAG